MARRTTNQPVPEAPAEAAADTQDTTEATTPEGTAPETARRPRRQSQPKKTSTAAGRGRRTGSGGGETAQLVEALLRNRGSRGASQQDLELAVGWAQGVRAEAAAIEAEAAVLRKLGPRGKQQSSTTGTAAANRQRQQRQEKQQALDERRQRLAMNQALLDGISAGRVSLDVREGQLLFLHGEYAGAHAATEAEGAPGGGA